MAFDSLATIEEVDGAMVKGFPNAGQAGLNLYGQLYGLDKDGEEYSQVQTDLAWVSTNLDTDSVEWANAVKVKKALNIAIDRQTIVDTLLSGFGKPLGVRDWMGHDHRQNPDWNYEFDPVLAKQMLAEAGFPDGFDITLTPYIRNALAEAESCHAAAQYW